MAKGLGFRLRILDPPSFVFLPKFLGIPSQYFTAFSGLATVLSLRFLHSFKKCSGRGGHIALEGAYLVALSSMLLYWQYASLSFSL